MAQASDTPFWDFSLGVYARSGVAPACLALQDRHGLDVNLLLFCCWAGRCGRALTAGDLKALRAAARPWHEGVVRPLRQARRWLKGQANASAQALRRDIKAQELEAERIEQHLLGETLPLDAGAPAPDLAAANLKAYLSVLKICPEFDDTADLTTLLCGSFEDLLPLEATRLLG